LDDLDGVAVGIRNPRDQQTPKPFVWGHQTGGSIRREFGEGRGSVVGPEDDGRSLAFRNRVEAMVIACRGDGGDADFVTVEGEIDVNRLASVGTRKVSLNPRLE
jgi:hypothetical protein